MTTNQIIQWMADHGHTSYETQINDLNATRWEVISDAGRYWQFCEFTQRTLGQIEAQIEEIKQRALDRYEDWASD